MPFGFAKSGGKARSTSPILRHSTLLYGPPTTSARTDDASCVRCEGCLFVLLLWLLLAGEGLPIADGRRLAVSLGPSAGCMKLHASSVLRMKELHQMTTYLLSDDSFTQQDLLIRRKMKRSLIISYLLLGHLMNDVTLES